MNKILVGLLLGAALGAVDGMTAWFTPAVRTGIIGIVIGSTVKGMIAGIAAGWFARKVQSVAGGIAFGLLVGALLAYGVAAMQHGYYFEIMLPGSIVGAIVGWATQRYGRPARVTSAATLAAIFLVTISANARAAEPYRWDSASSNAAAEAEKTEASSGDLIPPEMAMAMPKMARRMALPSAVHRGRKPAIRAMPRVVSAIVAATAMNGYVAAGRNELTSPV